MKCCAKYSAGMLKEPVVFERSTRLPDGSGGYGKAWVAIAGAPTRAMVKARSGQERWASERIEAHVKYLCVVRYFGDITEKDRVVFRGKAHNISFINNLDLRDKWLEIDLQGGVAP